MQQTTSDLLRLGWTAGALALGALCVVFALPVDAPAPRRDSAKTDIIIHARAISIKRAIAHPEFGQSRPMDSTDAPRGAPREPRVVLASVV